MCILISLLLHEGFYIYFIHISCCCNHIVCTRWEPHIFLSFKFIAITKRQNKHNKAIIIVLYEDDEVQKILREGIF